MHLHAFYTGIVLSIQTYNFIFACTHTNGCIALHKKTLCAIKTVVIKNALTEGEFVIANYL